MATEVNFDIVATDKASKPLDQVATKAEKIEKLDPTVDVKADTRGADHTLDGFEDQLARLTDTDKAVVVALRAGAAAVELRDLAGDIALLDASDPDVNVKFERYAEVSGQLDQLETQLKELGDGGGADMHKVSDRLDGIGESAGKAQGAVHSMAGNAVGDFAATATGIGPLGEALGQLTETAVGAEGSIAEIATAGAGMAGLAAAMYVVQGAMKSIAETKAFHQAEVDAYAKSIRETGTAVGDLTTRLTEADKVMGAPSFTNASNWLGLSDSIRDVTAVLVAAGLTVEQYTELVGGSADDIVAWGQAQKDAGTFTNDTVEAIQLLVQAQADAKAATDASTTSSLFFYDSQRAVNAEGDRWTAIAQAYASTTEAAAQRQKHLADESDGVTAALQRQTLKLQSLKGEINDDQAWINLETQFDNVRQAGDDAVAAQVEANKHRGKSAQDAKADQEAAEAAMRNFETATNDAKLAVIEYGTAVLHLPPNQVVDIVTNLNGGGLDDAERRLADLKRQAQIRIDFIRGSGAGFLLTGSTGASGTSTAVPSLSVVAAPARWARINGR